jgi:hypothetical protein
MGQVKRRIYGVDFSGGADAGRKIWLAAGRVENDTLIIDACFPGEALPDSSRERETCLAALRVFMAQSGEAIFGLDFPLSVPQAVFADQTWLHFIRTFAQRFPSPQEFRRQSFLAAHGHELKRPTDVESKTPFSPYNLRLYRQTYYGLRDVIGPLVIDRVVRVLPMQSPRDDQPWLIEICPASTLKRLELYVPYKGKTDRYRAARTTILAALTARGPVRLSRAIRSAVLDDPEGDALDSVIAALAVFRAAHQTGFSVPARYRREGFVFC